MWEEIREPITECNLVIGNPRVVVDEVKKTKGGNTELIARLLETFSIQESHDLVKIINELDKETVIVIGAFSITNEAQNALLKVLESPNKLAKIVLVIPSRGLLVDTLYSRFRLLLTMESDSSVISIKNFLGNTKKERLVQIKSLLPHPSEVEDVGKRREEIHAFLEALGRELEKRSQPELIDIYNKVVDYSNDTSPSYRLLLEQLVYSLPTFH